MARDLIERLIADGRPGDDHLQRSPSQAGPTADGGRRGADERVGGLENDREQWDFYADQERIRIDEVVRMLNEDEDIQRAIALARMYQKEERWRTEQNLRRLEMVLGQLTEVESPKAVIYFADTMRSNPGEHYLSFFGAAVRSNQPAVGRDDRRQSLRAHRLRPGGRQRRRRRESASTPWRPRV